MDTATARLLTQYRAWADPPRARPPTCPSSYRSHQGGHLRRLAVSGMQSLSLPQLHGFGIGKRRHFRRETFAKAAVLGLDHGQLPTP